jgi:hypothetical protein
MMFELIRAGLPNTAAIMALAIMPVVALATRPEPRRAIAQTEQGEPATICQAPAGCAQIASAVPEWILE